MHGGVISHPKMQTFIYFYDDEHSRRCDLKYLHQMGFTHFGVFQLLFHFFPLFYTQRHGQAQLLMKS